MEVWKWVKMMIIHGKIKKSSKPLNIYAKTFVKKDSKKPAEDDNSEEKSSNKPLNIYAKTFVQKDSKKPAEDDNSEENLFK